MDRLIIDTGVLVAIERRDLDAAVIADDADIALAAITVSELLVGVELATPRHREQRRRFVDALTSTFTVLPFDQTVAEHHAHLVADARRSGRPRGAHDLLVAATARATGRRLVTSDARGFESLPGVVTVLLAARDE